MLLLHPGLGAMHRTPCHMQQPYMFLPIQLAEMLAAIRMLHPHRTSPRQASRQPLRKQRLPRTSPAACVWKLCDLRACSGYCRVVTMSFACHAFAHGGLAMRSLPMLPVRAQNAAHLRTTLFLRFSYQSVHPGKECSRRATCEGYGNCLASISTLEMAHAPSDHPASMPTLTGWDVPSGLNRLDVYSCKVALAVGKPYRRID
mmetsp:Transcript_18009/g.54222  ORF Transcript_18009/g.54222 Transcript_18009/m.54222 type:complete len:202 (+) Transcript_18009:417-1022(+)